MKNGNPVNESVMKRFFIPLSVALCALFVWSCEKNEDFDGQAGSPKKLITFWAHNESHLTKTQLSDKYTQVWSPGDEIAVAYKGEFGIGTTTITEPSASAGFQAMIDDTWEFDGVNEVFAVYPATRDIIYLPDYGYDGYGYAARATCYPEQQAVEGTFAPGLFPSIAVSMDSELHFKNLFGGVVFQFSEGCEDISAVTLHANDYGYLSGGGLYFMYSGEPYYFSAIGGEVYTPDVKLLAPKDGFEPDKYYYMALPRYEFPTGFSLCFYKGDQVAVKRFTSAHEIKRSTFAILKGMNNDLTWQSESSLCTSVAEEMTGQWLRNDGVLLDFGYTIPGKAIWVENATSKEFDENFIVDLSLLTNIWGDIVLDWNGSSYYLCSRVDGKYSMYDQEQRESLLSPLEEPVSLTYMGLWLEPEPGHTINLFGAAVGERTQYQTLTLFKEIADNNGGNLPVVYIDKLGKAEDYDGIDVNGKVVVVNRGDISFSEKITNAYTNGAIGIIIVNNFDEVLNMIVDNNDLIPAASVPLSARELLLGKTSVPCYRPDISEL